MLADWPFIHSLGVSVFVGAIRESDDKERRRGTNY